MTLPFENKIRKDKGENTGMFGIGSDWLLGEEMNRLAD